MSMFSGIVIQGTSILRKGQWYPTTQRAEWPRQNTSQSWGGVGDSCCSPSCWKHYFLLGELTALWFYQLTLQASLRRRASIHQNEETAQDFSLSLQITHRTETSNQSFNKDDHCNSAFYGPDALHTPISSSRSPTKWLLAYPFYR